MQDISLLPTPLFGNIQAVPDREREDIFHEGQKEKDRRDKEEKRLDKKRKSSAFRELLESITSIQVRPKEHVKVPLDEVTLMLLRNHYLRLAQNGERWLRSSRARRSLRPWTKLTVWRFTRCGERGKGLK